MAHITSGRHIVLTAILAVLLGVGSAFAALPGPAAKYKVKGTFDIPKKEYKVGETVRGKFTVLNQERDMTMDVQRSEQGKLIYVKKKVKVKKGGRLAVPVEWKIKKPGKQVIQYSVNGSWSAGKKVKGFSRTFDYVINDKASDKKEKPAAQAPTSLVFRAVPLETAPAPGTTRCSAMDCLIGLARSCSKGEFSYSVAAPFPFDEEITVNARGYYKINGKDAQGVCTFTSQFRGAELTLSPKGRANALALGMTEAAVNAQIKMIQDSMNSEEAVKSIETCTGTATNVAQYFVNAQQGSWGAFCAIQSGAKEARCTVEPNLTCVTRRP